MEFDESGEHLATGDRGGRVVLFERLHPSKDATEAARRRQGGDSADAPLGAPPVEYRYLTEFQSHEPEFDYLKSLEIEEKINTLRWCHQGANSSRFLISANDKTIKLWKVFEKRIQCVSDYNLDAESRASARRMKTSPPAGGSPQTPGGSSPFFGPITPDKDASSSPVLSPIRSLRFPSVRSTDVVFGAKCRRLYGNAHAYHVNSLSVNSDGETYLSADDLRVNLWHLENAHGAFNVVDIKPANMEDLTEVITCASFHPTQCHTFAYSSSKGSIRLADMRRNALCNAHAKMFDEAEAPGSRSFFSEIIASISDIKFSGDGRYVLSRDFLTLKLWDLNMERRPVATFKVHEHLRSKLCDLYESDSIFDKFQCALSGDGRHVASGSYGNQFRCFDAPEWDGNDSDARDGAALGADAFEVTKHPQRLRAARRERMGGGGASGSGGGRSGGTPAAAGPREAGRTRGTAAPERDPPRRGRFREAGTSRRRSCTWRGTRRNTCSRAPRATRSTCSTREGRRGFFTLYFRKYLSKVSKKTGRRGEMLSRAPTREGRSVRSNPFDEKERSVRRSVLGRRVRRREGRGSVERAGEEKQVEKGVYYGTLLRRDARAIARRSHLT